MKPKLILHIGTEKTGTSSIQELLNLNRGTLNENGFHFVRSAGDRNNRAIPAYLVDDDKALNDDFYQLKGIDTLEKVRLFKEEFFSDFTSEITTLEQHIHTVVISSEHFHSRINNQEIVNKFKMIFADFFSEIKILCYLREQSQVCESWYSTALKNGHCQSFESFVSECMEENIYYNYLNNLSPWVKSFGVSALNVNIFDKCFFYDNNLLKDFIRKIDLSLLNKIDFSVQLENESVRPLGQQLILSLNLLIKARKSKSEVNKLIRIRNEVARIFVGKGQSVTKEDYKRISTSFHSSNKNLAKLFGFNDLDVFPDRDQSMMPDTYLTDDSINLLNVFNEIFQGGIELSDKDVDTLRDSALKMERQKDYVKALSLMELARKGRAKGPMINSKINEYRYKLKK